jgi:tRNA A37 N6-isopentenylltransferase MiaA
LHARIDGRVEAMIDAGLVDEVRRLVKFPPLPVGEGRGEGELVETPSPFPLPKGEGVNLGRTARQAVGYREALAYLAGEHNHDEMVARIKARTRRFAKRQGTWFRSLSECRFVDIAGEVDGNNLADRIAKLGADVY